MATSPTTTRKSVWRNAFYRTIIGLLLVFALGVAILEYTIVAKCDGNIRLNITISDSKHRPIRKIQYLGLHANSRHLESQLRTEFEQSSSEFSKIENPNNQFTIDVGSSSDISNIFRRELKRSQQFDLILIRIEFNDGAHVFRSLDVPQFQKDHPINLELRVGDSG